MIDIARKTAYEILLGIETDGAYANAEILARENRESDIDGDFLRRLIYGVLEKKIYLDYILDKLITKGIKSVDKKTLTILRMGIYQLIFMDSVPAYAAIDSSVELAKVNARGRDGFVNAVLRNYTREESIELPRKEDSISRYLSVKYSVEESIIHKWIEEFGEAECESLLAAINKNSEEYSMDLRVNVSKKTRDAVKNEFLDLGIDSVYAPLSERSLKISGKGGNRITETEAYKNGLVSIQSQESTWIADLVDPKPGEKILDACAAPGGKTMALAEAMLNRGKIVAWDIYDHRVDMIREQAERLGITIVSSAVHNAGEYIPEYEEAFDSVLVDVPCSGYGVMSEKPEIRYRKTDSIIDLPDVQRNILQTCSRYVKYEGKIIYSTCTINIDENKKIIQDFLDRNHWFKLEFERQLLPQEGYKGFYVAVIRH